MNRSTILTTICILFTTVYIYAQAQQITPVKIQKQSPTSIKPSAVESKIRIAIGEVVSADDSSNTITIKTGSGKNYTFNLDEKTSIIKKEKNTVLRDISPGEKVIIAYESNNNKKVIQTIKVVAKKQAKKMP